MDILSNFVERLKELMSERNLNAPALAKEIGANRTTISELLRGNYLPSLKYFISMIEYFNCSADYLLGLIEFQPENVKYKPVKPFAERLRRCLEEAKKSEYRLQEDLKISTSLTYKWLHGKTQPTVDSIVKLSKYFGFSVDFLLGREN